jgi:hypothetical protein
MRWAPHNAAQVSFTYDGNYLLSGARQDPDLLCWDLRRAGGPASAPDGSLVWRMGPRSTHTTNQRIAFSVEPVGRHVLTGGCDGVVRVSSFGCLGEHTRHRNSQ